MTSISRPKTGATARPSGRTVIDMRSRDISGVEEGRDEHWGKQRPPLPTTRLTPIVEKEKEGREEEKRYALHLELPDLAMLLAGRMNALEVP